MITPTAPTLITCACCGRDHAGEAYAVQYAEGSPADLCCTSACAKVWQELTALRAKREQWLIQAQRHTAKVETLHDQMLQLQREVDQTKALQRVETILPPHADCDRNLASRLTTLVDRIEALEREQTRQHLNHKKLLGVHKDRGEYLYHILRMLEQANKIMATIDTEDGQPDPEVAQWQQRFAMTWEKCQQFVRDKARQIEKQQELAKIVEAKRTAAGGAL